MAVESGAAAVEHAEGMPQLDFSTFPNQIFWLVVTLVVTYLILNRLAVPRIRGILAERSRSIEHDLELADTYRKKAVEAEEAYERALNEARARAREIVASTRAGIQADLDAATSEADARIAAKLAESEDRILEIRDNAARSVELVATEVAGEIVRSVLPAAQDPDSVRTAVAARMEY